MARGWHQHYDDEPDVQFEAFVPLRDPCPQRRGTMWRPWTRQ
ncbi:MAG TPA: hypothetical protein VEA99_20075 [Gemmatimonadaceae bacterium]|nr:hypothetical protein [Gemmatimonadaceae bacterium]